MLHANSNLTGPTNANSGMPAALSRNIPGLFAQDARNSREPQLDPMSNSSVPQQGHRDNSFAAYKRSTNNHALKGLQDATYGPRMVEGFEGSNGAQSMSALLHGAHSSTSIERQLGQSTQPPATGSVRGHASNFMSKSNFKNNRI